MLIVAGSSRSFMYRTVPIGRGTVRLVSAKPEGTEIALSEVWIRGNRVDQIEQVSAQRALFLWIIRATHFFEMWSTYKMGERLPVTRRTICGHGPELKRSKSRVAEALERIKHRYRSLRILQ